MSRTQDIIEKYVFQPFSEYLVKRSADGSLNKAATAVGAKRYDVNLSDLNNSHRVKPNAAVPFKVLRRFSVGYDVARSCINVRKRQIAQMDWKIVPIEDDTKKNNTDRALEVTNILKRVGGYNLSFRNLTDMIIEDLMVLDAVALEKRKNLGGGMYGLLPIDAATIKIRTDSSGRTPEPPEVAYQQVIRGNISAEFTADEMYYGMLNPRTSTPYGLAPLETLVMTVNSALKSSLLNLEYMTEGNVPEGFYTVPKEWTATQIREFQEIFDSAIAGDGSANSRIRFMPEGTYTPTHKVDDMRYKEFSEWLMKITCSVFDVQPIEIGFEPKQGLGGAGFSEGQDIITNRKAIIPLANFMKDIWDRVIQEELGYSDLEFRFEGLEYKDPKNEAEVNEILIRSGQVTVDEIRGQQQKDPLGVDKPFVLGTPTFIDEESMAAKAQVAEDFKQRMVAGAKEDPAEEADTKEEDKPEEDVKAPSNKAVLAEITKFRMAAINRMKAKKSFRKFNSDILPRHLVDELNSKLTKAKDVDDIRGIFETEITNYRTNFITEVKKFERMLERVE